MAKLPQEALDSIKNWANPNNLTTSTEDISSSILPTLQNNTNSFNPWDGFKNWVFGSGNTNVLDPNKAVDRSALDALMGSSISNDLYNKLSGSSSTGGAFGSLANYGKAGLGFMDKYSKGIGTAMGLWNAYSGNKFNRDYLKQVKEQNAFNRATTKANIGTSLERQGTQKALNSGYGLQDAYGRGKQHSLDTMAQYGIK